VATGKQYISWATEFDTYRGQLNWQDLPLAERTAIALYELDGTPTDLDIQAYVMGTNLRRIQYDGLRTVITRVAIALEAAHEVVFGTDEAVKYSAILPYMRHTALGQELISLYEGAALEQTSYRMGELEFLAQSGSKASPLDGLLSLPADLQLQGILDLLKPKDAFRPPAQDADPNNLPFSDVMPLLDLRKVNMYASYTGALQAASLGLVNIGALPTLSSIVFMVAPVAGLIGAFVWGWWWLLVGLIAAVAAFRYSRTVASKAVLRRACTDEAFFNAMRRRGFIWLERV
jgi:hypothetical protein